MGAHNVDALLQGRLADDIQLQSLAHGVYIYPVSGHQRFLFAQAGEALFLRQADGFLYALPLGLTGVEKGLVGFGLMHELGFLLRGVGGPGIDSFHNDPP